MYSLEETKTDQKDTNPIKEEMTESKGTQEESREFEQALEWKLSMKKPSTNAFPQAPLSLGRWCRWELTIS